MPTSHQKFATLFDTYPLAATTATSAAPGTRSTAAGATGRGTFVGGGGGGGGGGGTGVSYGASGMTQPLSTAQAVMPLSTLELATPQPVYGFGTASLRFNNTEYPGQAHGLVNKQVVNLEDGGPLPLDRPMGPGAPSLTLPAYASRFRQEPGRSFGPTPAFGPDDPTKKYVLPKPHFVNGRLTEPDVVEVAVPRGAAADPRAMHAPVQGVVTPLERREAMAFEKANMRARLAHRAEKAEHVRRVTLMRQAHPRGLHGVEAPGMADARVYSEESLALARREEAAARHAADRAQRLHAAANSHVGYPLLEHDDANGATEKIFQSRARAPFSGDAWGSRGEGYIVAPAARTHPLRQPGNNQERVLLPPDPVRIQALVNARQAGRNFDIITGVEKTYKCTVPERQDRWRAHESHIAAANSKATTWGNNQERVL
eukprot:CAMPEP_0206038554 /NCGR_PEP_ID=MMETSP1466-20131121/4189_1 /ASSEMBLY_ACC=CAM_ASM_001126 /TAXON_ID=44452 /ORGANISM="Pavlova gyrans, Strain CCMP608" /LENGTH=428 /DNA_ID=CAMNT_0053413153 /DNA_START=10 /DNA_END=1293 /DNA_ORIENTATION=+